MIKRTELFGNTALRVSYHTVLKLSAGLAMLTFGVLIPTENVIQCCNLLYYPTVNRTRLNLGAYELIVNKEMFLEQPSRGTKSDACVQLVARRGPAVRQNILMCTCSVLALFLNTNTG